MNSEVGTFVLRQLLNSTAIIGPLFLLVGFSFYIFKVGKRSVFIYLTIGVIFCAIGIWCLAAEFKQDKQDQVARETIERLEPEPAAK